MTLLEAASGIVRLFEPSDRRKALGLLVLIAVSSLVEIAGIASIVPFLAVVSVPESIEQSRVVSYLYQMLGAGDVHRFLVVLGLVTAGMVLVSNLVTAATAWAIFRFTFRQGYRTGRRLLSTYLVQPYSFFLEHNTVDLGRNIYDEVPRVVSGVILPAMQAVAKCVSIVMIVALLLFVDVTLAVIVFFTFGGAYYLLHKVVQRRLNHIRTVASEARAATLQQAMETLSGIKELKILGRERYCIESYSKPASALADADASNQILGAMPKYLLETVAFGGIVMVVIFLLSRGDPRFTALPTLALYAFAGYRLLPALQHLHLYLNFIQYYSPVLEVLNRHLAEGAPARPTPDVVENIAPLPFNRAIDVANVTFQHPTAKEEQILRGLTLRIPAKSTVGIVGTTGSGKSTLIDIVIGLLRPSGGEVRVDGAALSPDRIATWQANIGYVPQQIYLSDGTIGQNIAFGTPREDIDTKRLVAASKIAQLHEFVSGQPAGYETVVGERGVRLSGGQRQRIGIARALYRNPAVLVFDEATSALDNLTEVAIMEALRNLMGEKTIILVAHRLTTLRLCDQIVLLENGRVGEQGTYAELLSRSQHFRELDSAGRVSADTVAGEVRSKILDQAPR